MDGNEHKFGTENINDLFILSCSEVAQASKKLKSMHFLMLPVNSALGRSACSQEHHWERQAQARICQVTFLLK